MAACCTMTLWQPSKSPCSMHSNRSSTTAAVGQQWPADAVRGSDVRGFDSVGEDWAHEATQSENPEVQVQDQVSGGK
eukprot:scaffold138002_cov36-Prasinocladus_malaysianus.AAC.1